MSKTPLTEADFISRVNLVAEAYGCRTVFIEPKTRMIEIEGPEDRKVECAAAMEEILGEYLTDGKVDGPETLMGWPV